MNKLNSPLKNLKTYALLFLILINVSIQFEVVSPHTVLGDSTIVPPTLWTPISIANATAIPLHHSNYLKYVLQEGKMYHAFLVGNWSETGSQTDYDIYVNGPGGYYRFTEATGIPEAVYNDEGGQYFVPPRSGEYTFEIHNDEGDSNETNPAVFMLIEHIETDKVYEVDLEGRNTKCDDYTILNTYSCEFTTSSRFTLFVDTPEDLDMFEARIYPMASESDGYNINGVPTPAGELVMGNTTASYGGYNTSILGFKWPDLTTSCVTFGEKMSIEGGGSGELTTYFLVLIAEYSASLTKVPFYIKTSTVEPTVGLNGTIGEVFAGEAKRVSAVVSSPNVLKGVWMNFTVNGAPLSKVVQLSKMDELYEGEMPIFEASDVVDWSICAQDELGNVGRFDSSFSVMARTETSCFLSTGSVQAGEEVEAMGFTSVPGATIKLLFSTGTFRDSFSVKADDFGNYRYRYTPKQPGEWTVKASFEGNDVDYPSESPPVSFTMISIPTTVRVTLDSQEFKVNKELHLSGFATPAAAGIIIDLTLVSGGTAMTETLSTKADGSFSFNTPLAEGEWDVVAQVRGSWKYGASSSGIIKASVLPLTILDQAIIVASMAVSPPYIYIVVLASAAAAALVIRWKIPGISSRLPKPIQEFFARLPIKANTRTKKADSGDRGRYHRQEDD